MRIEIVLFIITGLIVANIYTDGKYLKQVMTYKKYYQMGGVIFGALVLYWIVKKNPASAKEMVLTSNEYLKYLPVDRNVSSFIEPLIDFTNKQSFANDVNQVPVLNVKEQRQTGQGDMKFKRSVSESKKKYIAAKQGWKCRECETVLPATYEVDHIKRLQHGGSNEIDNLQALCPSCHRNKTMLETLSL